MRSVQNGSQAYEALAETFKEGNKAKFLAEMDVGVSIWSAVSDLKSPYPLPCSY